MNTFEELFAKAEMDGLIKKNIVDDKLDYDRGMQSLKLLRAYDLSMYSFEFSEWLQDKKEFVFNIQSEYLQFCKSENAFDLFVEFIHSFYIKEVKKIYDFYLPEFNVLIEIDGDFWHCNPNTKYAIPECKTQELNIENDKIKNKWAFDNNYKLLRFWEYDINNNLSQVIETLKKELNLL